MSYRYTDMIRQRNQGRKTGYTVTFLVNGEMEKLRPENFGGDFVYSFV